MNSPTNYLPPTAIFGNGIVTGNLWGTPNAIFLVDGVFATSDVNTGSASDFTVSNFLLNIPQGSIILGFEIEIIGKRGAQTSPVITLDVSAYDNTNGADAYYPYSVPITTFTTSVSTVVIGGPTELFSTVWTVDMANNFKLALTANGDISLDSVLARVYFTPPATLTLNYNTLAGGPFQVGETITGFLSGATAVVVTDNGSSSMTVTNVVGFFQDGETITGGTSFATAILDAPIPGLCIDCSSPIQVQAMYLELPFLVNDTKFYLKKGSFSYPNGIPVQPGDVGSCGGTIPWVFDESKRKMDGQNFEENAMLDTNAGGTWTVLSSGVIEVDLGAVTQRGLDFKTPGGHVATNMSNHDANSKVIISNNEPYNLTLVRRCQVDTVFSPPITVQDEGVNKTTSLHLLNFVGEGVIATLSAIHNILVTITDRFVRVSAADTTSGYLQPKLNVHSSDASVTVSETITTPGGNEVLDIDLTGAGGGTGGHIIQDNGVPLPAEPALNFVDFFTVTDVAGVSTDVDINVTELANDNTFNTALGNNANFISTLTSNVNFQTAVNLFVGGSGSIQIDQTPDNGTYGLLGGAVDGVNTTYTVSLALYGSGKLQVYLNGLIQLQGAGDDWVETVPGAGTFDFNTAPVVNDVITVVYNGVGSPPTDELVSVSAADTTPGYLQPKINVHSSDASVTVSETITNPAGNEILDIDLTGAGGGSSSFSTVNLGDEFIGGTEQLTNTVGEEEGAGELGWQGYGSSTPITIGATIAGEANHPGIFGLGSGVGTKSIYLNSFLPLVNGAEYRYIFRPNLTVAEYEVGLAVDGTAPEAANRIILHTQGGATNFKTSDNANTIETTALTAITNGQWVNMIIKITTGATVVECWLGINGAVPVLVASHSTNIPLATVALSPVFFLGGESLDIDYFSSYIPGLTR